ncbi:hypothetical protein PR202_gb10967 [Eleusine coracana subsp. coracana]|uniref:Uncharacterized protein n=1 Tax=Eleusine coracana subsp. coracana TaxID=191504 RepID=A0AAV5EKQ7_ELECO|nr:hypothetical protein PR202_gb10967 [Eleusine coracana subsp. coracana]
MSDGRVLVDFYAQSLQLPLIPPNLPENTSGQFPHGMQYGWFEEILERIAPEDGFGDPLVACCSGDGPYHTSKDCNKKAKVWGDPDRFVSWDGMRMTEKAYNIIVEGVLKGPFTNPPLLRSCSN